MPEPWRSSIPPKTDEELAADAAARVEQDATFVGAVAEQVYEAALRRSGVGEKSIPGKWADLAMHLRAQWITGVEVTLAVVAGAGGARAAASAFLGDDFAIDDIDSFLSLFGPEGSVEA